MNKSLLLLFLLTHEILTAGNYNNYQQHVAKDRLLLFFERSVTIEQKAEILNNSGLIRSFTHLPSPALTVCFTDKYEEATAYFRTLPEVRFVSFFMTDGEHYAGVLDRFFVKIKNENFRFYLLEKVKQGQLAEVVADKYIPNLYKVTNTHLSLLHTIALCNDFEKEGWVDYASPDYLFNPMVCSNDPLFVRQWNIKNTGSTVQGNGTTDADMDVDSAWIITTGDPNIKVSIIDSGVDTLHADLLTNLLPGYDAVDDSTDGYPTPNFKEDGHGTCCAGIVAAEMDNGIGIAGVAPNCKIIPVRAFYYVELTPGGGAIPISTADAFANAIGWSWSVANADILSNSWGLPPNLISILPGGTQPVEDAIHLAHASGRGGKGVAMFFSSGNENGSAGPIWPASLWQTIAVNATSMCDERKSPTDCSPETWGGDYGRGLDFSAPGVRIPSTDMRGNNGYTIIDYYNSFNGTSAACPNAAAVGALVLSLRPDLTAEGVRHVIAQSCDKVGGYGYDSVFVSGTWSNELGYGRVNAFRALQYAQIFSSIRNEAEEFKVSIYPNPSSGNIFLEYTGMENARVTVCGLSGNELFSDVITQGVNTLHLKTLPAGMYLLKIERVGIAETKKITLIR